jgi:hypothetical protein
MTGIQRFNASTPYRLSRDKTRRTCLHNIKLLDDRPLAAG